MPREAEKIEGVDELGEGAGKKKRYTIKMHLTIE